MARARSGPTEAHRALAGRLRTLRLAAGMSQRDAAEFLPGSVDTLRRIEGAATSLDEGQVYKLLRGYGEPAEKIEAFLGQVAMANLPGWWHQWRTVMDRWQMKLMGVEGAASLIRVWDPALVPTLLRTRSYARALEEVLRPDLSPAAKDARAELLMERQRRLAKQRTRIWAIMPALALQTLVGDDEVRKQILWGWTRRRRAGAWVAMRVCTSP
ncbi:Scr1 family TA system antitoxin-like transcriptional regulator [Streptomyces formicae]